MQIIHDALFEQLPGLFLVVHSDLYFSVLFDDLLLVLYVLDVLIILILLSLAHLLSLNSLVFYDAHDTLLPIILFLFFAHCIGVVNSSINHIGLIPQLMVLC